MSDNKVDNKLDFRNVKQTQLDSSQVLKGSFSELQSGLRTYSTNAILKDSYTHFIQEVNQDGLPTKVEYWQATSPSIDKLQFGPDVSGSKAGTYIILQEYLTKKTHVLYYVVSGSGAAPGIGDVETPINILNNDSAAIIAYATGLVINTLDEFSSFQGGVLSSSLEISYLQFGETNAIDVSTSGFIATRLNEGTSFIVGEATIDYDIANNPIYNGNTLVGLKYNPYTASFDVIPKDTTIADKDGDSLDINPDGSINTVKVKDYDNFKVLTRDSFSNITKVEYKMGTTLVRTIDITYDSNGCLLTYTETEV